METKRLEAFSDGVLAIIITIMVLEMKVPHGAEVSALRPLLPVFLSYVLSFVYLGIYWNNYHHMLHVTQGVNGIILWANLHLLFWLSLIPFVTGWMGENNFAPAPTALYGVVLLLAALAYWNLQRVIIAWQGPGSILARAIGRDLKGKISLVLYSIAIPAAFVHQAIAGSIYVLVALVWLVPDPPHRAGTEEQILTAGPGGELKRHSIPLATSQPKLPILLPSASTILSVILVNFEIS